MQLALAEAIVAGVTAVTCSALLLVDRVTKREADDDRSESSVDPVDGLRPWHDPNGPCALCGQKGRELAGRGINFTSRLKISALVEDNCLLYTCGICGGTYRTRTKH